MLSYICPKLPMRNKVKTREYYINKLGFKDVGSQDFEDYLILRKDNIEIHFFLFEKLDPKQNYGQVYIRIEEIDDFYKELILNKTPIHPNSPLKNQPWGQREFALLDPDKNLLTFGQNIL